MNKILACGCCGSSMYLGIFNVLHCKTGIFWNITVFQLLEIICLCLLLK